MSAAYRVEWDADEREITLVLVPGGGVRGEVELFRLKLSGSILTVQPNADMEPEILGPAGGSVTVPVVVEL